MSVLGRVTHALVSRLPRVFGRQISCAGTVDFASAAEEHSQLVAALRKLDVDVLELPPDENTADSVCVGELAVVVNGQALVCRASPERDASSVASVLRKHLGLKVMEMDEEAVMDANDVLFTGKEFFVGVSSHTNIKGAEAVAKTWPEFPCTPINVEGAWCLTSLVSVAGPGVLCVGAGPEAQSVLRRIEREASHSYQILTVTEDRAANVLSVNGALLHRAKEEAPRSQAVFGRTHFDLVPLHISELTKTSMHRCLSSFVILVRKSKQGKRRREHSAASTSKIESAT